MKIFFFSGLINYFEQIGCSVTSDISFPAQFLKSGLLSVKVRTHDKAFISVNILPRTEHLEFHFQILHRPWNQRPKHSCYIKSLTIKSKLKA